ncbi:MAG TPA: DUF4349 domain-containing protein [Xanthomonadaceae bacterium]|nr:DUF4349 domain-containing protein [Xanthomonadaceae bacterium]
MQWKQATLGPVFGLLLASLTACGQQASKEAAEYRDAPAAPPAGAVMDKNAVAAGAPVASAPALASREEAPGSSPTTPEVTAQMASSAATYTDARRKFIRTAHAEFRVKDVYLSALAIEDIAAAQGGFVIRNDISAQTQSVQRRPSGDGKLTELAEYTLRGELTVRVPSEKTQTFLRALVGQIDYLDHRTFEATDAQFDILRQQLAYQRGQEAQQDLGQAEQQGGKLGQKAEAIGARNDAKVGRDEALIAQKQFEDRVDFSTIDLSLYQSPKIRQTQLIDVEAEFRNHGPRFFARLESSLRVGWYTGVDVLLGLIAAWPLWLAIAVGIVLVRGLRKKRPPAS